MEKTGILVTKKFGKYLVTLPLEEMRELEKKRKMNLPPLTEEEIRKEVRESVLRMEQLREKYKDFVLKD